MIRHLSYDGGCVYVHAAETSLKATKAFTHGSIAFDLGARTVTFAQCPPVAVPMEIVLRQGDTLKFQLMAPDGALRKQTRTGVLTANEKQPGILRVAGMAQTPRRFAAEEGWRNEIRKYRAYFTHPGLNTSVKGEYKKFEDLPEWLRECIGRQKALWNRLAWLCREARRKCSPAPTGEIIEFVNNTILPEIDAFNLMLGRKRTKEKMRHPVKLKTEAPGMDGLWSFVGELRGRMEKGRAVPKGLLEKVVEFAQRFKAEYTPLNEFLNNFSAIAEREAGALGLKRFEIRPTVGAFKAVLDRRKTLKSSWSEGWPLLKYPDSPKADNWGLHYYFNKAGVDSATLESGGIVPGLSFGPPRSASETGHEKLHCKRRTARRMREALISIPGKLPQRRELVVPTPRSNDRFSGTPIVGDSGEGKDKTRHELRFAILEHRLLPPLSHVKEWKLIYRDGKLWLCLVVELQYSLPRPTEIAAGLEIGWRRTEEGIRFATLYEPATKTIREGMIDLKCSPRDHKDRIPFRIDLGPTRWERRNITLLFPDWKPGDGIPNAVETRMALAVRRDYLKDMAKIRLRKHLGERAPAWLEKTGGNGLHRLAQEFMEDAGVQEIVGEWQKKNRQIAELIALYFARTTKRIEYGQQQVAHDICSRLQEKGIGRLVVESKFLAKVAQQHDNEDPESLKRSQKYRQFAAPGKFAALLKNTAAKYGITVEEHENVNITRICHNCDHLNPATEKEKLNCEGCGREIQQDHNAAINLSRFGGDPELAEMALRAGR